MLSNKKVSCHFLPDNTLRLALSYEYRTVPFSPHTSIEVCLSQGGLPSHFWWNTFGIHHLIIVIHLLIQIYEENSYDGGGERTALPNHTL